MKNSLTLILVLIFLGSCSSKFSLQKRRYGKGYYFASSTNKKSESFKTSTDKASKALSQNTNNQLLKTETTKVEEEKIIYTQKEAKTLHHNSNFSSVNNTKHHSEITHHSLSTQNTMVTTDNKIAKAERRNNQLKRARFLKVLLAGLCGFLGFILLVIILYFTGGGTGGGLLNAAGILLIIADILLFWLCYKLIS